MLTIALIGLVSLISLTTSQQDSVREALGNIGAPRGDQTFHYGFDLANGISVNQTGYFKTVDGVRSGDLVHGKKGCYHYTSPEGAFVSVVYIAEEKGYKPHTRITYPGLPGYDEHVRNPCSEDDHSETHGIRSGDGWSVPVPTPRSGWSSTTHGWETPSTQGWTTTARSTTHGWTPERTTGWTTARTTGWTTTRPTTTTGWTTVRPTTTTGWARTNPTTGWTPSRTTTGWTTPRTTVGWRSETTTGWTTRPTTTTAGWARTNPTTIGWTTPRTTTGWATKKTTGWTTPTTTTGWRTPTTTGWTTRPTTGWTTRPTASTGWARTNPTTTGWTTPRTTIGWTTTKTTGWTTPRTSTGWPATRTTGWKAGRECDIDTAFPKDFSFRLADGSLVSITYSSGDGLHPNVSVQSEGSPHAYVVQPQW